MIEKIEYFLRTSRNIFAISLLFTLAISVILIMIGFIMIFLLMLKQGL